MEEELKRLFEEKRITHTTTLDEAFYKKLTKTSIDGIVLGNFRRDAIEHFHQCVRLDYPVLATGEASLWSVPPDKLSVHASLFVMSQEDVSRIIAYALEMERKEHSEC